jgi:hypothetical protein
MNRLLNLEERNLARQQKTMISTTNLLKPIKRTPYSVKAKKTCYSIFFTRFVCSDVVEHSVQFVISNDWI